MHQLRSDVGTAESAKVQRWQETVSAGVATVPVELGLFNRDPNEGEGRTSAAALPVGSRHNNEGTVPAVRTIVSLLRGRRDGLERLSHARGTVSEFRPVTRGPRGSASHPGRRSPQHSASPRPSLGTRPIIPVHASACLRGVKTGTSWTLYSPREMSSNASAFIRQMVDQRYRLPYLNLYLSGAIAASADSLASRRVGWRCAVRNHSSRSRHCGERIARPGTKDFTDCHLAAFGRKP